MISSSEVCRVIVSRIFKFVQKIAGRVFELIWCIKARFFQIFTWYTIRALHSLKSFPVCGNLSLLYAIRIACFCSLCFFMACPIYTFPCNNSAVRIEMYAKMTQGQKQMFIFIWLCLIQQSDIFSNFNFNIFNVFFPA